MRSFSSMFSSHVNIKQHAKPSPRAAPTDLFMDTRKSPTYLRLGVT